MSSYRILLLSVLCISGLTLQQAAFAHPDHEAEDMLLANYGNLGKVEFPVSCKPQAQKTMNIGVSLLHHMMYAQAELVFTEALKTHPDCAMLHWGYSMTLFHPLWPDTISSEALKNGETALLKAKAMPTTTREKAYINAAAAFFEQRLVSTRQTRLSNWAKAQKNLQDKYPDDIDADALFSLSLLATASPQDKEFKQQQIAGERLHKLFQLSPMHPGVIHYSIHAFDNSLLASKAVGVARAYDKIAPDVPHALHMPSHIFVRLGMWEDVIAWNTRSAKAALNYPSKDATSMHYVHAVDYLIYGYLQTNEVSKAQKAFEEMNAHHPVQQNFAAAYAFAAVPARLVLEKQQWKEASQLPLNYPDYFDWSAFPEVRAITVYTRGLGAARTDNIDLANASLKNLDELYQQSYKSSPAYWAILVDAQRKALRAWISFSHDNVNDAINQLRVAADLEDSIDKDPVTPGAVLPIREQLGDMLLLANKKDEAAAAFKASLKTNPNRRLSVSGLLSSEL